MSDKPKGSPIIISPSDANLRPSNMIGKNETYTKMRVNPDLPVEFPNLIPIMTGDYRKSAINYLKNWFLDSLEECILYEREACAQRGLPPYMNQARVTEIQEMLDKVKDFYHLQALSNYVFVDNEVPTWEMVRTRARTLKSILPGF